MFVKQTCHPYFSHLYSECEPVAEFLDRVPRLSPGPAWRTHQSNRRPTDKLQSLSWNPGPACGSDPSLLAGGVWLCHRQLPATWSSTRIPLSTTSHEHRFRFHVRCVTRRGLEGMAHTDKFRRAPDQSCSYFTIANIHINNECAKRLSLCTGTCVSSSER